MKQNTTRETLNTLNQLVQKEAADRERLAATINRFRHVHQEVVKDRKRLADELERERRERANERQAFAKEIQELKANCSRFATRCQSLEEELHIMASAIEAANREFNDTSSLLLDTAAAVEADFAVNPATQPKPAGNAQAEVRPTQGLSVPTKAKQQLEPLSIAEDMDKELEDSLTQSLTALNNVIAEEGLSRPAA